MAEREECEREVKQNQGFFGGAAGYMPAHRIDELFMKKHNLEAGVRLVCAVDNNSNEDDKTSTYKDVFALSEVLGLEKVKKIIGCRKEKLLSLQLAAESKNKKKKKTEVVAVYIHKFTVSFVDSSGTTISSKVDVKARRKHGAKGTEYSAESFDILMQVLAARISTLHNYCVCDGGEEEAGSGEAQICALSKQCPQIRLELRTLDAEGKWSSRKFRGGSIPKLDVDRIVKFEDDMVVDNVPHAAIGTGPNLMISAACLRRLLERAGNTVRKRPGEHGGENDKFMDSAGAKSRLKRMYVSSSSDDSDDFVDTPYLQPSIREHEVDDEEAMPAVAAAEEEQQEKAEENPQAGAESTTPAARAEEQSERNVFEIPDTEEEEGKQDVPLSRNSDMINPQQPEAGREEYDSSDMEWRPRTRASRKRRRRC